MGTSQSKDMDYYNMRDLVSRPDLIQPELLAAELNGEVRLDDYLGKSMNCLNAFAVKDLPPFSDADCLLFEDASLLLEPGYQVMEQGYHRKADGTVYLAWLTDLGQLTGDAVDWWFTQCDDDDKYRWWHPLSHGGATFDASFYAAMPWERPPGHYVDHVQIVQEVINHTPYTLHYEFLRPGRYFDTDAFAAAHVTACIVIRIHLEHPRGLVAVGYAVHMVRALDGGRSELRSRVWLGDILFAETPENYYFAQTMDYLANTWLSRSTRFTEPFVAAYWLQMAQKMACLKTFLQLFKTKAKAEQETFMTKFEF